MDLSMAGPKSASLTLKSFLEFTSTLAGLMSRCIIIIIIIILDHGDIREPQGLIHEDFCFFHINRHSL